MNAGEAVGRPLDGGSPEVVMLSDGSDFEGYLMGDGFGIELKAAIETVSGPDALERFKKLNHGQKYKNGTVRDYESAGGSDRLVVDFCRWLKGSCGAAIADAIIAASKEGEPIRLPAKVKELLTRIEQVGKGLQ